MTLLDAQALVAFIGRQRARKEVGALLRGGDAAVAAPNLAETLDVMVRVFGKSRATIEATLVVLLSTTMRLVEIGEIEARTAGALRAKHYHRIRTRVSLADCCLLACAAIHGARVATSDPALANAARSEGIELVALPDSSGRRP